MAEITATDPITNDEDLIDSRDVIARIEELSELEAQERRLAELRALETHPGVSDDEAAELASLREQAEKYGVGLDEDQTERAGAAPRAGRGGFRLRARLGARGVPDP